MIAAALAFAGDLDTPTGGYGYDRQLIARLPDHGVTALPLGLGDGFPFPNPARAAAALDRLAATAPGTVLLVDGLALGALPAEGLARLGRPLVGLVHHPLALEGDLAPEMAAALEAGERAALSTCAAVIAVSPETRRVLVSRYAVPPRAITLALPGTAPAERSAADGDPPRLLAVGSLTPRKGHGVLLDALETLGDLDWRLAIAGPAHDAATAAMLERRVAGRADGRIRLAGPLDAARLDGLYAASDVLVHPAFYEGYGMVLAEALRRGLPIVCTTGGAAGETVPDAAGLKVPPGDAPALAAALRRVIGDPALRRRLADGAFTAGQRLPTWDETARIVAGVLAGVEAGAAAS